MNDSNEVNTTFETSNRPAYSVELGDERLIMRSATLERAKEILLTDLNARQDALAVEIEYLDKMSKKLLITINSRCEIEDDPALKHTAYELINHIHSLVSYYDKKELAYIKFVKKSTEVEEAEGEEA